MNGLLPITRTVSGKTLAVIFLVAIAIFACCKENKNNFAVGDPFGTLLVSQALIEHGSIRLDPYADRIPAGYQFQQKNGHTYYYFPVGTSIMAVPMVAVALAAGKDMLEDNNRLQKKMTGLVNIVIFILLFLLARRFIDETPAVLLAAGFWFASSLSSILGTALWSHNFAILFALASLWLICSPRFNYRQAALAGCLLFLSYLCRPTLALLLPLACIAVLAQGRITAAIVMGALFLACMLIFMRLSWLEFGQLLPDYYMPKRLRGDHFTTALYGNMLSPSRGFLIYTPMLLLLALQPKATLTAMRRHAVLWLTMILWIAAQWISISRLPHWWGGFSYGARLMVDVMPAVFVLLITTISCWEKTPASRFARYTLIMVIAAGAWMHTYQGLFNRYAGILWNVAPNIDHHPELVFDWRYPQFMHTKQRDAERKQEYQALQ